MAYITEIGNDIEKAASILRCGDLVAIPTETVYGLAGNAYNEIAVKKIFEVKQRPLANPLIVHTYSPEHLQGLVYDVPDIALKLMDAFCPGPLTLLLQKSSVISDLITANQSTVAIRIPDSKPTLDLLQMVQFPLVAPSANLFMRLSPTRPAHVYSQLCGKIPYILDGGNCSRGIESTIVGVEYNTIIIYRPGAITAAQLTCMGVEVVEYTGLDGHITPGRYKKHYAPRTKLVIAKNIDAAVATYVGMSVGILAFGASVILPPSVVVRNLSEYDDLNEAACNLYNMLFELDNMGLDVILCSYVPDRGIGIGINERLLKAATIIMD